MLIIWLKPAHEKTAVAFCELIGIKRVNILNIYQCVVVRIRTEVGSIEYTERRISYEMLFEFVVVF